MSEMLMSPPPPHSRNQTGLEGLKLTLNTGVGTGVLQEMFANGLGSRVADLDGNTQGGFALGAERGSDAVIGPRTAEMHRRGFSGDKRGPMTPEELDEVMNARAPWEKSEKPSDNLPVPLPGGEAVVTGPVLDAAETTPLTGGEKGKDVEPSDTEMAQFFKWVQETFSDDDIEDYNKKYGQGNVGSVLFQMFRGEQPDAPRAEGTFVHAGSGEELSRQDVADQLEHPISPDAQHEIEQTVDAMTGEAVTAPETSLGPEVAEQMAASIDKIVAAAEHGELFDPATVEHTERGEVGDGVLVELTTKGSGEHLTVEEAIVHVDGHEIALSDTAEQGPTATIDGEPVTTNEEAQQINELLGHVVQPEAELDSTEVREEAPEADTTQPETEIHEPTPAQQSSSEQSPRQLSPEQQSAFALFNILKPYATNPLTYRAMQSAGVDFNALSSRFESGKVDLTGAAADDLKQLFTEIPPTSALWQTEPGVRSELGQIADRARARLLAIINSL